ncbi:hypothetical protein GCM10027284_01310 [Cyclobacterium sediminis]
MPAIKSIRLALGLLTSFILEIEKKTIHVESAIVLKNIPLSEVDTPSMKAMIPTIVRAIININEKTPILRTNLLFEFSTQKKQPNKILQIAVEGAILPG